MKKLLVNKCLLLSIHCDTIIFCSLANVSDFFCQNAARGLYLGLNCSVINALTLIIKGLKLVKAYQYLCDVKEHKRIIPFWQFAGGVGWASQAKEFKATHGCWPKKSVKSILHFLKNAESNADARNLELEDLYIKNIKTRCHTYRAQGQINPYQGYLTHMEIILSGKGEEVEKSTEKSTAVSLTGLN
ncbi:ribosomal protein L22 [Tricholoma matsutake]|nr:ribosomal protein L22 [Tricholoma matsutake 945]